MLFICSFANAATTYYVDPAGSDSNDGSEGSPFLTPQHAANIVDAGDTVIVKDGTYTDDNSDDVVLRFARSGTSGNVITFKSENKHGAILDGQSNTTGRVIKFFNDSASYINLEDFEMKGALRGVHVGHNNTDIIIFGNLIHDTGRICTETESGLSGMFIRSSCSRVTVDSNIFHTIGRLHPSEGCSYSGEQYKNHDHGIYTSMTGVTIVNNVFYNIKSGWPLHFSGGGTKDIFNNTFIHANPFRDGAITLWHDHSNITIENNIFGGTSANAIDCFSEFTYTNVNVNYNLTDDTITALLEAECSGMGIGTANNISGDVVFVDEGGDDYDIQTSSPAKDAGTSTNAPALDIDATERDANPDMGAYEFGGAADTEDPTTPENFGTDSVTLSSVTMSWDASSDNVGVDHYNIWRDDVEAGGTDTTTFIDTGLSSSTNYGYQVAAEDAAGNTSSLTGTETATTASDTTKPTISATTAVSNSSVEVKFSEDVDETISENTSNYSLDNAATISAAVLGLDNETVTLTTSTLVENTTYTLTVNNIEDLNSNVIIANSTDTFTWTEGLIAYWKFDEGSGQSLADSSGGTSTATLGTDTQVLADDPTWTTGKIGSALEFDATDDVVLIVNDNALNIMSEFTITAWVYPTGWGEGNFGRILSKEPTSLDDLYLTANNAPNYGVGIFNDVPTEFDTNATDNDISLNEWSFIALTYSDTGNRTPRLYKNGVEVGVYDLQTTLTGTLQLTSNAFRVGNNGAGTRTFDGKIDEIRVYNKVKTEAKLTTIYNNDNMSVSLMGDCRGSFR